MGVRSVSRFTSLSLLLVSALLIGCGGETKKSTKEMEDIQNKAQLQVDDDERAMQKEVKAAGKKK